MATEDKLRWVLPVPFLILGLGAWLYLETQNEVRAQMERARDEWRNGRYEQAADLYKSIYADYPASRFADQALWEIGTIFYVNFYDVDQALAYLNRLLDEYPESLLKERVYLRLAEIHEKELGDPVKSLEYWDRLLQGSMTQQQRRQVLFQMGNAHLKLNQFDEALGKFRMLVADGSSNELLERSLTRIGTILQMQHQYQQSAEYFQRALQGGECAECRKEARLGLIESYEFMGEYPRAIAAAREIPASEYPAGVKEELLGRLGNKARYYAPGLHK